MFLVRNWKSWRNSGLSATQTFEIGEVMVSSQEKVEMGDVIYIEANSGSVRRVGRSDAYATEFDLEAEEYVPLPKVDKRV